MLADRAYDADWLRTLRRQTAGWRTFRPSATDAVPYAAPPGFTDGATSSGRLLPISRRVGRLKSGSTLLRFCVQVGAILGDKVTRRRSPHPQRQPATRRIPGR